MSDRARYCAVVPRPAYAIDRIKTGQCGRDKGQLWVAELPFPEIFACSAREGTAGGRHLGGPFRGAYP